MAPISIIETEEELGVYYKSLLSLNTSKIAIDLEGDQGSVKYHYSISIIQCFDGVKPVIIDVKRSEERRVGKEC